MAMSDHERAPQILVAGCGKLGGEIATSLLATGDVYGLRRNPDRVPSRVKGIGADLTQPDTLSGKLPDHLDVVIYCLTPSSYDEQGYHQAYVTGLENLLSAIGNRPLKHLIFISSTSVFAQDDDSWVNESSSAAPDRFTGQQILQGEQTALNSGQPATVIRFSGIYGPSRQRFLEEVLEGRMNPQTPAPFSNRIHETDAANAVAWLAQKALSGHPPEPLYIASDCEPVRLDEVVNWVREQIPCKAPVEGARKGGRAGSKRCSNQKLLESGFTFRYPDFRTGYLEMIRQL
ncbi:DUF1731 domain-containing protein [Marinobacter daepoensis]|uniref:DUF1731 domain-containing protein n=1 Tax=Marinobacter daepoensis TaxID=262077 RepID=A0ABS3B9F9_9GAMM|nr:sugar nucleotide-binding protein [Marinobacter daepoensis]MBN7768495.1 DUF1731 domain-containing protein [Marinobacter daepoensis]MBY6079232.1 DUF1731 domain-containing protein [Marinobacter daepoensis]